MKRPSAYTVFIHLVVISLGIEVYLLAMQNNHLKANTGNAQLLSILKPGDIIHPISAMTMDGHDTLVSYEDSSRDYLLFVFSTKCHFCRENLPNWTTINREINGPRVSVLGISIQGLEETKSFVESNRLSFPVIVPSDKSFSQQYKISSVPQTILVHVGGVVNKVWDGVLS